MGQRKKKRDCPALDRSINAAECGTNRHSNYSCPGNCPYNPFAPENYEQMLDLNDELEKALMKKTFSYPELQKKIEKLLDEETKGKIDGETFEARLIDLLHVQEFREGLSVLEFWEQEDENGLKNDLQILLKGRLGMRFTLIEVRDVFEGWITAIDLLDEESGIFKIYDWNLSSIASRYNTLLIYLFPTPHYVRCFGSASHIKHDDLRRSPKEEFDIMIRHLGFELDETPLDKWCLHNAMKIKQAYLSLAQYRLKAKWEASDVGVYERLYQLNMDPEKCRYRLLSNVAVEEMPESEEATDLDTLSMLQWYALSPTPEKAVFQKDDEVHWGNIKITKSGKLRVQTFNRQKDEYLNMAVMEFLGTSLEFESAVEQEQSQQSANKIKVDHPEWVPEELLSKEGGFTFETKRLPAASNQNDEIPSEEDSLESFYRNFIDDANPALDGNTPRQASQDLILRPKLCRLIKQIMQTVDQHNKEKGAGTNLEWMFEELNLQNIHCKAPQIFLLEEGEEDSSWSQTDDDAAMYWAQKMTQATSVDPDRMQLVMSDAKAAGLQPLLDSLFECFELEANSLPCSNTGSRLLNDLENNGAGRHDHRVRRGRYRRGTSLHIRSNSRKIEKFPNAFIITGYMRRTRTPPHHCRHVWIVT